MNDEAAARRQQRLRTFLVSATTSGEMLCRIGNMHHIAGAGRGIGMTLGTGTPVSFFLDGLNSASVVLRDAADEALALEVNNRKYTPGTHVSMWAPLEHPEWSMPWHLNEDATLSPVDMQTTRVQREVVLGWSTSNPHAKILSLVDKKSPNRLCVQLSGALLSLAPRQASQSDAILSIASPACSILGQDTRKAFGLSGHVYVLKKHNGRGQGLSICPVQEARSRHFCAPIVFLFLFFLLLLLWTCKKKPTSCLFVSIQSLSRHLLTPCIKWVLPSVRRSSRLEDFAASSNRQLSGPSMGTLTIAFCV